MKNNFWGWVAMIAVTLSIGSGWYYFSHDRFEVATFWMAWTAVLLLLKLVAKD
jgi:hypothetical protein